MKKDKWSVNEIYAGVDTVDSMIRCIDVLDRLNCKYPNDEYIEHTIEILRDEICHLFGGTINTD